MDFVVRLTPDSMHSADDWQELCQQLDLTTSHLTIKELALHVKDVQIFHIQLGV